MGLNLVLFIRNKRERKHGDYGNQFLTFIAIVLFILAPTAFSLIIYVKTESQRD